MTPYDLPVEIQNLMVSSTLNAASEDGAKLTGKVLMNVEPKKEIVFPVISYSGKLCVKLSSEKGTVHMHLTATDSGLMIRYEVEEGSVTVMETKLS